MDTIYFIPCGWDRVFDYPIVGTEEQMQAIMDVLQPICRPIALRPMKVLDADMVLAAVEKYAETENRAQGLQELPDLLKSLPFSVDME